MQIVIGVIGVVAIAAFGFLSDSVAPPTVVENIDIERYMGTWYAVASIPTTFERDCATRTTATYELLEDGKVRVTNTCYREDGTPFDAMGQAWIPNPEEPGKLKVSFVSLWGWWLFGGDYWILELDPNYALAYVGLGLVAGHRGEPEKGMDLMEKARLLAQDEAQRKEVEAGFEILREMAGTD